MPTMVIDIPAEIYRATGSAGTTKLVPLLRRLLVISWRPQCMPAKSLNHAQHGTSYMRWAVCVPSAPPGAVRLSLASPSMRYAMILTQGEPCAQRHHSRATRPETVTAYYLDASAVVKRYADELGSTWIRHLTHASQAQHTILLAEITLFRRVVVHRLLL